MEYEIDDDPQGQESLEDAKRDGGIVEDHMALKNQSSVAPEDYPKSMRKAASLVRPNRKA
jgi:hypothetical protein